MREFLDRLLHVGLLELVKLFDQVTYRRCIVGN